MKRNVYVLKALLCLALIVLMIFSNVTPAYAWKVKTHVYSANLIIDEIKKNNGYVEIQPFGLFEVLPEYRALIDIYPDYFRAGSVGPDFFPDIIIGQTIVHPGNESYTSGQFIESLWSSANRIPESSKTDAEKMRDATIFSTVPIERYPEDPKDPANKYLNGNNKMQAQAFILGYMAHAAGDYFGHSYVNHWAGGTWPDVTDGLNSSEKDIIRRHSVLEAYIDNMIPQEYKSDSKNTIKIPQRFVFDRMIVSGKVNIDNMAKDTRAPEFAYQNKLPAHLDLFFDIRDSLRSRIAEIDDSNIAEYVLTLQFAQKAYCEAWVIDIDRGLGDWVVANEQAAQQMLYENGNMDKYIDELNKWADKHALSMLGAPDVAVDVLRKIGDVTDFIAGLFPKAVRDAIEEAKKDLINYFIKKATGINVKEYTTMLNPPLSELTNDKLFPVGSFDKIIQEMGNFNISTNASKQDFVPFVNTLTLMKLTLIGNDGIQELRKRAGSTDTSKFGSYEKTLTSFIYNMDYGYDWNEEALIASGFFLGQNGSDQNLVTRVIFNLDGSKRPSFSDMTQGPIHVVTNKLYSSGEAPKVKVKYENAPDQVNAVIGLYPADDYSISTHNWKNIARNTSGEYEATVPQKDGKYHFRIYDNKYKLLATSDTIEVIEKDVEGPPHQVLTDIKTINANEIADYIEQVGSVFNVKVIGSLNGNVWGDGIYTLDSDLATAAVHAGIVKPYETKTVKITILPGQDSYAGTIKNGVESYEYGEWPGSFEFTDLSKNSPPQGNLLTETNKEGNSEVFKEGIITTWPSSVGIGYRLFRSKSANDTGISVTDFYITGNKYADVNVDPSTTYYYKVFPVLAEANPFEGIEEKLGNHIYEFTLTTGSEISKSQGQKNSMVLQIDNPNVNVNGKEQEIDAGRGTTPLIVNGRTMVPIRAIVEAMGGTIDWEQTKQQITLTARNNTVKMWLGKGNIEVNGVSKTMDIEPFSQNGRTYVPIRFATENLNAKVDWINTTREIVITY